MPSLFSTPKAPSLPAPVPQPVPTGPNQAQQAAQAAQTIAMTQSQSGRASTNLVPGTTLGPS
jgi:hypothetical protein